MNSTPMTPITPATDPVNGGQAASAQPRAGSPLPEIVVDAWEVVKRFGRVEAVNGITTQIPRGQIIGLVGPNGAGKSTFLKLIIGLQRPDDGRLRVLGETPGLHTKRRVAYEPEGDCLYDWMTIQDAMTFVSALVPDWDARRAEELLDFLHLEDRRHARIRALSKGLRARVKLLLTVSRNADLILLDEPLSGIDPPSRARIIQSLISQFRVGEQTIVISTHEVAETEGIFERVIFLDRGQVRLEGDAQELRQRYGRSIQGILEEVYA